MIQRHLIYSQLRNGTTEAFLQSVNEHSHALRSAFNEHGLNHISVFTCGLYVFVYAEALTATIAWDWPASFKTCLEEWPVEPAQDAGATTDLHKLAIPLIDIFHDGLPQDFEWCQESRKGKVKRGSVARLKPDMVSSYIFYHYQMQEETPESFNKSYIIGALGRLIFSYSEVPAPVSVERPKGLLSTRNTPLNWHEVMQPHFDPWDGEDGQLLWKQMERVLGYEKGEII